MKIKLEVNNESVISGGIEEKYLRMASSIHSQKDNTLIIWDIQYIDSVDLLSGLSEDSHVAYIETDDGVSISGDKQRKSCFSLHSQVQHDSTQAETFTRTKSYLGEHSEMLLGLRDTCSPVFMYIESIRSASND